MSSEQPSREWTAEERSQAERITVYCLLTAIFITYLICRASGMDGIF